MSRIGNIAAGKRASATVAGATLADKLKGLQGLDEIVKKRQEEPVKAPDEGNGDKKSPVPRDPPPAPAATEEVQKTPEKKTAAPRVLRGLPSIAKGKPSEMLKGARAVLTRLRENPDSAIDAIEEIETVVELLKGVRSEFMSLEPSEDEVTAFDAGEDMQSLREYEDYLDEVFGTSVVMTARLRRRKQREAEEKVHAKLAERPLTPTVIWDALEMATKAGLITTGMSGVAPFEWNGKPYGPKVENAIAVRVAERLGETINQLGEVIEREEHQLRAKLTDRHLLLDRQDMNIEETSGTGVGTLQELSRGDAVSCVLRVYLWGIPARIVIEWKDGKFYVTHTDQFKVAKLLFAFYRKKDSLNYGRLLLTFTEGEARPFSSDKPEVSRAVNDAWEAGEMRFQEAREAADREEDESGWQRGQVGTYQFRTPGWNAGGGKKVVAEFQATIDQERKIRLHNLSPETAEHLPWLTEMYGEPTDLSTALEDRRVFWLMVNSSADSKKEDSKK